MRLFYFVKKKCPLKFLLYFECGLYFKLFYCHVARNEELITVHWKNVLYLLLAPNYDTSKSWQYLFGLPCLCNVLFILTLAYD